MKNKNTPNTATATNDDALKAQLTRLFIDEGFEVPDECVDGKLTRKVEQLESQIKSLTSMVAALAGKVEGKPVAAAGRVDALEVAKSKK